MGASLSVEIYLVIKKLRNFVWRDIRLKEGPFNQRDIFVITRSFERNIDEFNTELEVRDKNEYEGSIIVIEDMLQYNRKANDPLITRGKQKDRCFVIFQSLFDLLKRTFKNNINLETLMKQSWIDEMWKSFVGI